MKKLLIFILSFALLSLCLFGGMGCNDNDDKKPTSSLTGTYTSLEAIKKNSLNEELRIYGKESDATGGNLYCSSYPFNTVNGSRVCYTADQRLKLKRDFTYNYQYSIKLTNSEDWGKDFATISVQMSGTFSYRSSDTIDDYEVTLENPTQGTLSIFGCTVTGESNIYAWTIKSSASYVLNIEYELSLNPEMLFNRYIKGRTVMVNKPDKELTDDIFFADVMNDIAVYSDYTF